MMIKGHLFFKVFGKLLDKKGFKVAEKFVKDWEEVEGTDAEEVLINKAMEWVEGKNDQ